MNILAETDYLRQRIDPQTQDRDYLSLIDLKRCLQAYATQEPLRMLDYGCGGSPYRFLFPNAQYLRADIAGDSNLDYVIPPDSRLAAPDADFDLILSSQVLEHVPEVSAYLAECLRLLKPGGRLLLSTHGGFEDHACPGDYRRWTPYGLARDVAAAGFSVTQQFKLTAGPRYLVYFMIRWAGSFGNRNRGWGGRLFRFIEWAASRYFRQLNIWCEACFADYRVIAANEHTSPIYVGLLIEAHKPGNTPC